MSIKVRRLEDVVSHYMGVLEMSWGARKAVEEWGLDSLAEISSLKELRKVLLDLLADGVEEI